MANKRDHLFIRAHFFTCPPCRGKQLTQTIDVIGKQDLAIALLNTFVVGKLGRAESALDPAPIGMIETIALLKPEHEWRNVRVDHDGSRYFNRCSTYG